MLTSTFAVVDDLRMLHSITVRTCVALEKPIFDLADAEPLHRSFDMLEQYRFDTFDRRDPHKKEGLFERIARKKAQGRAKVAFTLAHNTIAPECTRDEITVRIEQILNLFCKGKCVNRTDAQRFFYLVQEELGQHLKS